MGCDVGAGVEAWHEALWEERVSASDVVGHKGFVEPFGRRRHVDTEGQYDQPVTIEDDVWCGANVTILKGVTIGRGSVVAAGAVVTKSFPPYSIIGGVPAKLLKMRFTPEQIEEHERKLGKQN